MTRGSDARPPVGKLASGELPFRDNPFEALRPAALASIFEWPPEARRFLAGEGDCLHIVGDCGMGKTTLLEQIGHQLSERGASAWYACVPPDGRLDLDELDREGVALLDETDRLGRRAFRKALTLLRDGGRRAALAAHRSQLRQIRGAGLSALYLALRPLSSADEVARVFRSRVALAASTDQHPLQLTPEATQALLHHSRGNIERCLELGYEIFEDLERPRAIEVADVEAAAASLARARGDSEASR